MKRMINSLKGTTLVELMVAMSLGVILMGACLHIFLMIKQIYQTQLGLSRIQENGRIVNVLLGMPIQQAGNIGCNGFGEGIALKLHNEIDKIHYGLVNNQRIVGLNKELLMKNPIVPKTVLQRAIADGDILWVKSVSDRYKISKKKSDMGSFYIKGLPSLKSNQIIFLSTCSEVNVLRVDDNLEIKDQGTLSKIRWKNEKVPRIQKSKHASLELGIFSSRLFYIGKTSRQNSQGNPVYALYSTDLNGRTLELVEGVEAMKILYGEKQSGKISFLSSSKIHDWNKVVVVHINLLLNSIDEVLPQPSKYINNNKEITASDKLIRKWWKYEWSIKSA